MSLIHWCARFMRSSINCIMSIKNDTMGEHLGQVNPKYSDEDLPTLNEKELMGELGVPESAPGKTDDHNLL